MIKRPKRSIIKKMELSLFLIKFSTSQCSILWVQDQNRNGTLMTHLNQIRNQRSTNNRTRREIDFVKSHTFHSKILDFSRTDNSTSTDPSNGSPTKEVRPKTQTYDVKGGVQNWWVVVFYSVSVRTRPVLGPTINLSSLIFEFLLVQENSL